MGDKSLHCSLCCDKIFDSKELLVKHLSDVLTHLSCPICNNKVPSLADLIEHLNFNKCQSENTTHSDVFIDETSAENLNCVQTHIENINHEEESQDTFSPGSDRVDNEDNSEVGKMYVELLSKQLLKPCLQTQELKLVKAHGESRYIIMASDDTDLRSDNTTIVTKQNSDGTISLTDVKDMKLNTNSLVTQSENESEANQEEIYSCNTCGVTFSSVVDHIQNYHNDQDVVVEEPIEDSISNDKNIPIEYEPVKNEDLLEDKLSLRRVITDTGDIVEAPLFNKNDTVIESEVSSKDQPPIIEEVIDKLGRVYTRRYLQIDKFCDSIVKDVNKSDEKKGPFHKVIVKEMKTIDNGNKVKVYNCLLCGVYVPSLDDFKTIPCKIAEYKCPHCTVAYDNPKSLCAHMKVHKMSSDGNTEVCGPFKCEICSTIFPTNKSLKLHKRMHDPIKSRPIEPPVETSDVNNDKFLCSICDKLIPIDYRIIHQNSHNTDNKYNCDICNRKFHSNEYLEMHMSVHSNDKVAVNRQDKSLPYNCLYCSRQFARPHEKVKHERIHTGEKPHSCEICGKSFRVSYCLTLHMRTHTGARPYACHHCGKRFKAHSVYNHHLLTHSEVRAYKCPYCPKAFKTSVQLAGHKNSHTKPFSCQHCNRPFASLYAVRVHTETHARQNNLKFSCSLCGASYARTFALRDHIRQVHKQDLNTAETMAFKRKDWDLTDNGDTDAESMQALNKGLPQEINELAITSNEPESVMVVP